MKGLEAAAYEQWLHSCSAGRVAHPVATVARDAANRRLWQVHDPSRRRGGAARGHGHCGRHGGRQNEPGLCLLHLHAQRRQHNGLGARLSGHQAGAAAAPPHAGPGVLLRGLAHVFHLVDGLLVVSGQHGAPLVQLTDSGRAGRGAAGVAAADGCGGARGAPGCTGRQSDGQCGDGRRRAASFARVAGARRAVSEAGREVVVCLGGVPPAAGAALHGAHGQGSGADSQL